jgi:hypothetical protein
LLNGRLSETEFICGPHFTVADITGMVTVDFCGWAKLKAPECLGHLRRWHAAVSARPSAKAQRNTVVEGAGTLLAKPRGPLLYPSADASVVTRSTTMKTVRILRRALRNIVSKSSGRVKSALDGRHLRLRFDDQVAVWIKA